MKKILILMFVALSFIGCTQECTHSKYKLTFAVDTDTITVEYNALERCSFKGEDTDFRVITNVESINNNDSAFCLYTLEGLSRSGIKTFYKSNKPITILKYKYLGSEG